MSTPIRVFLFAALTYSCSGPSFTAEDTRGLGFSGSSGATANDGGKSGAASVGGSSSIAGSTSSGGAFSSGGDSSTAGESGSGSGGHVGGSAGDHPVGGAGGTTAGQSGGGSGGGTVNVDPCDYPEPTEGQTRTVKDCDGLCGTAGGCACSGDADWTSGDVLVIVGSDPECTFCVNDGFYTGYRLTLRESACARVTTQPGSDVVYAIDDGDENGDACSITRSGCAIAEDDPYSSPDQSTIMMSSTGAHGWIRIEIAMRTGTVCPLACP